MTAARKPKTTRRAEGRKSKTKTAKVSTGAKLKASAGASASAPAKANEKAAGRQVDILQSQQAPLLGVLPLELRNGVYKSLIPTSISLLAILQEKNALAPSKSSDWWQDPACFFRKVGGDDDWRAITALSQVSRGTRADVEHTWNGVVKVLEVKVSLESHPPGKWSPTTPLLRCPVLPSTSWSLEMVSRLTITQDYAFLIKAQGRRKTTAIKVERATVRFGRDKEGTWFVERPDWVDVDSQDGFRFRLDVRHNTPDVQNFMEALREQHYQKIRHWCSSFALDDSPLNPNDLHTLQEAFACIGYDKWTKTTSGTPRATVRVQSANMDRSYW